MFQNCDPVKKQQFYHNVLTCVPTVVLITSQKHKTSMCGCIPMVQSTLIHYSGINKKPTNGKRRFFIFGTLILYTRRSLTHK